MRSFSESLLLCPSPWVNGGVGGKAPVTSWHLGDGGPRSKRLGEVNTSLASLLNSTESPLPSRVTKGMWTLGWSEVDYWPPSKTMERYLSKGPHRASQTSLVPWPPCFSSFIPKFPGQEGAGLPFLFLCQIVHQTQSSKPLCELSPPCLVLHVLKLRSKGM